MCQIPKATGAYVVCLRLDEPRRLTVGRLGEFTFPSGVYLYSGSALGPGGLRARLGRHLHGEGRAHWHIDTLRAAAPVIAYLYLADPILPVNPHDDPLECRWSQALATMPGAGIPVPGFGASDCRASCRSHLVRFPLLNPNLDLPASRGVNWFLLIRQRLAQTTGIPVESLGDHLS
jgi:Uri superfamily endonuclease